MQQMYEPISCTTSPAIVLFRLAGWSASDISNLHYSLETCRPNSAIFRAIGSPQWVWNYRVEMTEAWMDVLYYARQQERVLFIAILSVRPSVCLSVCHTDGSVKNGAS